MATGAKTACARRWARLRRRLEEARPGQYDPRRIIREALTDVDPFAEPREARRRTRGGERELRLPAAQAQAGARAGEPAPFDFEAT